MKPTFVRPARLAALALVATTAAACGDGSGPRSLLVGFAEFNGSYDSGVPAYDGRARFFTAGNAALGTSFATTDQCAVQPALTGEGEESLPPTRVPAGDSLVVYFGDSVSTMIRSGTGTYELARRKIDSSTTANTQFRLVIPGRQGGFPAFDARLLFAEPFVLQPVPVRPEGEAVQLRWSPAARPDTGSAMLIELRYGRPGGTTVTDRVFCALIDDGSYDLPATFTTGWALSPAPLRESSAARLRIGYARTDSALVVVNSLFEQGPMRPASPTLRASARSLFQR